MWEECVKNPEKLMSLFMDDPLVMSQLENNGYEINFIQIKQGTP